MDRSEFVGQGAQLVGIIAIATEQDIARRIGLAEEGAFIGRQVRAAKTEDRRNHSSRFAGKLRSGKRANHSAAGKSPKACAYLTWQSSPSALSAGAQRIGFGAGRGDGLQAVNRADIDLALDHAVLNPGQRIGTADEIAPTLFGPCTRGIGGKLHAHTRHVRSRSRRSRAGSG